MKKRILSVLLAVCLVLTLAPMAMAAEGTTVDVWDGTSTENLIPDTSGVYQLNSAEDLAAFAELVNGGTTNIDASLNVDVDLDGKPFIPIGAYAYKNERTVVGEAYYEGTFDGNNNTIKNGSISNDSDIYNMGIFGFVYGGTVQNLTVKNVSSHSSKSSNEASNGVIIGILYQGTATNLTAGEGSSASGINRVGGVIGSVRDDCNVSYCYNYATVSGSGMYSGGIAGAAHDMDYNLLGVVTGDPATITYCENFGNITGNSEVGGIVGYTDQTTIQHCENEGNISATGNYGSGGIVGFDAYNPRFLWGIPLYEPDKGATIEFCSNTGDINGPRSGGILGTLGVTPGQDQPEGEVTLTRISGCTNSGAITGTEGKCGSIFGYQITYAHGDGPEDVNHLIVEIQNCTAGGTVNGVTPTSATPSTFIEEL